VLALHVHQVRWCIGQWNNRSIAVDRAPLDLLDLSETVHVGDGNGRHLLALLGKHLDARVVDDRSLQRHILRFVIQIHRRRTRSLRVRRHLQFFLGWFLKLRARQRRSQTHQHGQSRKTHHPFLAF
jgi:hypothetical protein